MITLKILNPITNQQENFILPYPYVTQGYWKSLVMYYYKTDEDICKILDSILKDMTYTITYCCYSRPCMTTYPIYEFHKELYCYFILKLNNQFLYNKYIDKIINRHIDNLKYENEHPLKEIPKKDNKKVSKKRPVNKYVCRVTKDLFTGENIYVYYNPATKDEIESKDPNLLDSLNAPKKKIKKVKEIGVPMSAMTFNFKKN